MNHGFPNLSGAQEDLEEGFWSSFSNVMMVILKIFLLVIVIMALNNRNLLDDLKHSVRAKEIAQAEANRAARLAQSSLKANASLEEQLAYYRQHSADLESALLSSRAETEKARSINDTQAMEMEELRSSSDNQKMELVRLEALTHEQADTLTKLRTKADESENKLLSLQGEFTELDKKYQKLLKPARSPKNKQVAEVVYQKAGYSLRKPGESLRNLDRAELESELEKLKSRFGSDLYVRIIIPDGSGLSYSEAWNFTNSILNRYDYYFQPGKD